VSPGCSRSARGCRCRPGLRCRCPRGRLGC
jgi:hypothetical protein